MTVFRATYSDWKLIRSRKVVQIILEVPLEQSSEAYDVLGGMPNPASEAWVGVARIKPESEVMPDQGLSTHGAHKTPAAPQTSPNDGARPTKQWNTIPPSQQAGILCNEQPFWKFLSERRGGIVRNQQEAGDFVRGYCEIDTRAALSVDPRARAIWDQLVTDYRAWFREPEYA